MSSRHMPSNAHAVADVISHPIVVTTYTGALAPPSVSATGIHPNVFGTNASIVITGCSPTAISYGQATSYTIHFDGDSYCGTPTLQIFWYDGWTTTINFNSLTCSYTGTFSHNYYIRGTALITAHQSSHSNSSNSNTVAVTIS